MPDFFDNITDWLLSQALGDDDISVTLGGLAKRLQDGGIPIARISMGRSVLHPVIALIDLEWNSDTGHVQLQTVPRKSLTLEFLEGTPFGDMAFDGIDRIVADLKDPVDVNRYDMFQKFANDGLTGYVAFVRQFGREQAVFSELSENIRGANVSFATRRFSGFSQSDIDGLARLVSALAFAFVSTMTDFSPKECWKHISAVSLANRCWA